MLTPVFRDARIVGYFASTCHAADIGGRILSAEAREVYEEGLRIPITKLFDRGAPNVTTSAGRLRPAADTPPRRSGAVMPVVPLSELTVRYYFTNEIVGEKIIDIGFSGLNPGFHDLKALETKQVGTVANPTFTADSFVEFGFAAGAGSIAPGQSVIIAWQYHGANFPAELAAFAKKFGTMR